MITGSHHQQIYWYATGRNRLLGQLPGAYLVAEQRWIPRRIGGPASARRNAVLRDRPLEQHLYRLPRDQRQAAVRHAVRLAADRDPGRRHDGRRVRHRLRVVPRAERSARGGEPQPAAALRAASDRRGRPDDRPADAARPAALVAGLRPVPRRLGVLRCRRRAPGQQRAGCRIAPATSSRRRASSRSRRATPTRRRCRRCSPTIRGSSTIRSGRTAWFASSGREYNGLIESPCFKDAHRSDSGRCRCFSCHALHKTGRRFAAGREWAERSARPGMDGNEACLSATRRCAANLTAHTQHEADSAGSSCYNCHMPYTTYGLLKTIRSHQIGSPSVAATRRHRTAQRVQSLSSRQDARVDR